MPSLESYPSEKAWQRAAPELTEAPKRKAPEGAVGDSSWLRSAAYEPESASATPLDARPLTR